MDRPVSVLPVDFVHDQHELLLTFIRPGKSDKGLVETVAEAIPSTITPAFLYSNPDLKIAVKT
jgi:hypothetical protein